MEQLVTCCLFVLAMGLPCLGQDSLVQMQHNNHLISLDISGDQMTASGRAQILAKPLSFSEHWGAINDISLTFEHETHFYCLVGCSFSAQITEKTELEISLSTGCAYQKKTARIKSFECRGTRYWSKYAYKQSILRLEKFNC